MKNRAVASMMVPSKTVAQSQALTIDDLVDLEVPKDTRISRTGKQIVYSSSPATKKAEHHVSSIWIAEVGKENSARRLTQGAHHDQWPQFTPDGQHIAFVSDRSEPGESSAIYLLPLNGGEPYPVTMAENKKAIVAFAISPDRQHVAFLSPDEKTAEQEAKEKAKDDAKVYGENWEYNRLRVVDLTSRNATTLYSSDAHVKELAWSPDSTEIAFATQETPDNNSMLRKGVTFFHITLSTKACSPICQFPGSVRDLIWYEEVTDSAELWFIASTVPSQLCTANAIYHLTLSNGKCERAAYGENACAMSLKRTWDTVAVLAQQGLYDGICSLIEFSFLDRNQEILSSDLHFLPSRNNMAIMAFALSTASQTPEVYSCEETLTTQLSQHSSKIAGLNIASAQPFRCKADDGTDLEAMFVTPNKSVHQAPWPTFVLVHGGPYDRVTEAFNMDHHLWTPWLASAGYAILGPNYRGSSGRGREFASAARGGMGTLDYDDVIRTVKAAIAKALVDPERVMIGGWSQGGFLSYLAVTRDAFQFKGAVCTAGVTDWDMMVMTSDACAFEEELAGNAPWKMAAGDTGTRHGSAIWHMQNIKTPVLIFHGEEDVRVPISQARGFHRGLMYHGVDVEMVAYPREGHGIEERAHRVDMLKRLRRFVEKCIGGGER